jgi:hypothetical protein
MPWSSRICLSLLLPCLSVLTGLSAAAQAQEKTASKPAIDLVICLDTSSSMNGLIDSAKTKLWDIVNELARAKPTPQLRIALFSYGSPQYGAESGWVHKDLDFTSDLDAVYQKLFALRINGGNEYVARVTQAALDQLQWSKESKALKLIFVCGNEPATQDPKIKLEDVALQAVKRDIIINTIHCRHSSNTAEAEGWQKLSSLAEGRFVSIDQNRGAVALAAPQDKKIAELGVKLNQTYLWYGKEGEVRRDNQLAQDANAAKLGKSVEAARAASKGTAFYRQAEADLVDRVLTDEKFDVNKVPVKELPPKLQELKPAERVKYVEQMKTEREVLQKQIAELNRERQEYIRTHQQKHQSQTEQVFDQALRGLLIEQGKRKGIQIPE